MKNSRQYSSPARDEAARATERRILDAAERLFIESGYAVTSVAAIAAEAGVSKQTVYNSCGSKPALLKRLYDVRLVGDDDPVPFGERPEVRAIGERRDPRDLLAGYGELAGQMMARLGPLLSVVLAGAAAGDPELRQHLETIDRERLLGAAGWVRQVASVPGALRPGMRIEEARDVVWAVNSVQTWDMLVRQRGWSPADYGRWLGRSLADILLDSSTGPSGPPTPDRTGVDS